MNIAVIIPIYKTELSEKEKISLQQCLKVLGDFQIIMICPSGFDRENFEEFDIQFEEFEERYFKDIFSYNQLMLAPQFYERFLSYTYILLYQLDAFVFKDELKSWCELDYDYIGAPWLATNNLFSKFLKPFQSKKKKKREPIFYKVGNGGLSLRKTKSFFRISTKLAPLIKEQLSKKEEIYAIEDVFWSLKVPKYFPDFKIPNYKTAAKFALDRKPKIGIELNGGIMPFGCHGFNKPKVIDFWMPIINKYRKRG